MKNNFFRIYVLLLGALMASCLEDDKQPLDPSSTQNVVEFLDPFVPASPAGAVYPAYSTSFVLAPSAELPLTVSYSGPNDNNQDIVLTLAVDPAALEEYNTQMNESLHGTTYDLMPEANYDIPNLTVTIPAGQTKATVPVTFFPENFDFSKNYAVPLRIVSTSTGVLSQHFSVALLAVGVRNSYDGIYEVLDGGIIRLVGGVPDNALGGDYVDGLTMDLTTLASNVVGIEPIWKDGSGVGGVVGTTLTINESTNQVTVQSSTNASLKNTPAAPNTYDPATRTFVLNFDWASNTRVVYNLTLRYVGPRP